MKPTRVLLCARCWPLGRSWRGLSGWQAEGSLGTVSCHLSLPGSRPAVKSVTAHGLLCPAPRLPATGRSPSTSCRTASVSPRTQGLGRGSLGPTGHGELVRAKLRLVGLAGSERG